MLSNTKESALHYSVYKLKFKGLYPQFVSAAKAWRSYRYLGLCLKKTEMITGSRTALECVSEFVYSPLRKGGSRPSVKLVGVVLTRVYTAYCTCSSENNGMGAPEMAR